FKYPQSPSQATTVIICLIFNLCIGDGQISCTARSGGSEPIWDPFSPAAAITVDKTGALSSFLLMPANGVGTLSYAGYCNGSTQGHRTGGRLSPTGLTIKNSTCAIREECKEDHSPTHGQLGKEYPPSLEKNYNLLQIFCFPFL
ncbi:hypothetical protein E2320_012617, partial [Naja naja]